MTISEIGPPRARRADAPWRPRVDLLATGGTIARLRRADGPGAKPTLSAEEIARSAAGIDELADLRTAQFSQCASTSFTFTDVLKLRDEIADRVKDGSAGVVVTQGTDTIEETAFAPDLLWQRDAPVVITGAMRNPRFPGPTGRPTCSRPRRSQPAPTRAGWASWS